MNPLRCAVCFDLDGVLVDTMPLHARAWQEALQAIRPGRRVSRRWIYEREGEPGSTTARILLKRYGMTPLRPMSVALLREKERRFQQLARSVVVEPRLVNRLRRFSLARVPLGLVTGTSSGEVSRMVPRNILSRFDVIVTGDCVRHGKPYPEPYQRAFRALRVKPSRAVVIENAPYGIRAARRASTGLVVALASSLPKRFLKEADLVVGSLDRLCSLLDKLMAVVATGKPSFWSAPDNPEGSH